MIEFVDKIRYLVDELTLKRIGLCEYFKPEVLVAAADEVASLGLEQGVVVAHGDQLAVALAALVRHAREMRVALLAVTTDHAGIVPTSHIQILRYTDGDRPLRLDHSMNE